MFDYNIEYELNKNKDLFYQKKSTFLDKLFTQESLPIYNATFRDKYAVVIDISAYQQKIDWKVIKDGGVSGVIARSSYGAEGTGYGGATDSLFAKHVQDAYDNDIPLVAYHVLDPGYYFYKLQSLTKLQLIDTYLPVAKDEQIQLMMKSLKYKKYYGIAIDFELYKDWNGGTLTEGWLTEVAKQFLIRVAKIYPGVPLYFYTGAWFVWNYCRQIENTGVLKNIAKLWTAYYPYPTGVVNLNSWSELPNNYPPESMTISFPDGKRVTQNPPYLGWDNWTLWQFTGDKFVLPGITDDLGRGSALDINFYNGTKEKLWAEWGFVPKDVPVVHTCPVGQHWEESSQSCVDDSVPPVPNTDLTEINNKLDAIKLVTDKIATILK